VGWIGRLTAIKGPDLFLESARRILAASASVKLSWSVMASFAKTVESHIRRAGLQDSVVLAGWKRTYVSVYSDLDLLLLTSIK